MSAHPAETCFLANRFYASEPFGNGQKVKVLTSFGHSVKNPRGGEGAAIWRE